MSLSESDHRFGNILNTNTSTTEDICYNLRKKKQFYMNKTGFFIYFLHFLLCFCFMLLNIGDISV